MGNTEQLITPEVAETLPGLFRERVRRTPYACAYRFFDALNGIWTDCSWNAMARDVQRWQSALSRESLKTGDRVAIMARNSRLWVMFDQAALGLGFIVVPLYPEDRVDNVNYVLRDAGVKLLVIGGEAQWERLQGKIKTAKKLTRIISIREIPDPGDKRVVSLNSWLQNDTTEITLPKLDSDALATIVYTSGTSGRPKGVMLSHKNILSNAYSGLQTITVEHDNVFLSFLPLSHTLERTVGYYLPMMCGATVAHTRSIPELANDLQTIKPTGLISVPRIFERIYAAIKKNLATQAAYKQKLFKLTVEVGWRRFEYLQGRSTYHPLLLSWPLLKRLVADKVIARLGGNVKVVISGGAALSPEIARVFIALGVPILQGYGLTEASPVVSVNRLENNIPSSIGIALPGVEVRLGENDELMVKGDNVMLGYWNNPQATAAVLTDDGWLHTGDKARIENNHIYITGRIKDIIVMANGEKVSPVDMEFAIMSDPLFDQVMVIGEARPYLVVLVVLNNDEWRGFAEEHNIASTAFNDETIKLQLLERVARCLHGFPGYAEVHEMTCTLESWSVENDLMTPTLKLKRNSVCEKYQGEIEDMYTGHDYPMSESVEN